MFVKREIDRLVNGFVLMLIVVALCASNCCKPHKLHQATPSVRSNSPAPTDRPPPHLPREAAPIANRMPSKVPGFQFSLVPTALVTRSLALAAHSWPQGQPSVRGASAERPPSPQHPATICSFQNLETNPMPKHKTCRTKRIATHAMLPFIIGGAPATTETPLSSSSEQQATKPLGPVCEATHGYRRGSRVYRQRLLMLRPLHDRKVNCPSLPPMRTGWTARPVPSPGVPRGEWPSVETRKGYRRAREGRMNWGSGIAALDWLVKSGAGGATSCLAVRLAAAAAPASRKEEQGQFGGKGLGRGGLGSTGHMRRRVGTGFSLRGAHHAGPFSAGALVLSTPLPHTYKSPPPLARLAMEGARPSSSTRGRIGWD